MLSCLNFINCNLKKELGQYPAILSSSLVHNSCNLNDTNQLEESCFTPASIVHVSNAQLDSLSVNMIVSIESPASGIQTLQMIKQWGYFLSYHDYLKSCTNTSLCAKPFIWKCVLTLVQVHFHANQRHFCKKGFAQRAVVKQRHTFMQKWPVPCREQPDL